MNIGDKVIKQNSPPNEPKTTFFSLAITQTVVSGAIKVALIVGTILAVINHGDKILTMSLTGLDITKVLLTYLVPYGVSTWSAVRTIQLRHKTTNNVSE